MLCVFRMGALENAIQTDRPGSWAVIYPIFSLVHAGASFLPVDKAQEKAGLRAISGNITGGKEE